MCFSLITLQYLRAAMYKQGIFSNLTLFILLKMLNNRVVVRGLFNEHYNNKKAALTSRTHLEINSRKAFYFIPFCDY